MPEKERVSADQRVQVNDGSEEGSLGRYFICRNRTYVALRTKICDQIFRLAVYI